MLLGYQDIYALVAGGVVKSARLDRVNAASLDLHLGSRFLRPKGVLSRSLFVSLDSPPEMETVTDEVLLEPGGFCLAETRERFYLPADIAAEVKLRSSAARIGLNYALAGWCDPGWHDSVLTLEFTNTLSNHYIRLRAGDRVVQMVFFRLARPVPAAASYALRGRYNNDNSVMSAKLHAD